LCGIAGVRELNNRLRELSKTYKKVVIENPSAKHYVAAGLSGKFEVEISGAVGFYLGTMIDGPHIQVNGNAGWFPADNMTEGKVVIEGSAGDGCGQGLYGGLLTILGDVGNRTGQIMKAGTIIIKGDSEFMTGLYMQGGQIICLGDVGESCGEAIVGGRIYVAGKVKSLGKNAKIDEVKREERASLLDLLQKYKLGGIGDHDFRKVVPGNQRPFYGEKNSLRLRKIGLNYLVEIDTNLCNRCGVCVKICPQGVLSAYNKDGRKIRKAEDLKQEAIQKIIVENKYNCVRCLACLDYCGSNAISIYDLPRFPGNVEKRHNRPNTS
jgi:glutamate synthase domain-containing protein 3/NAD-dependent dihydropyrimidine dehydrogenase PreA subunit